MKKSKLFAAIAAVTLSVSMIVSGCGANNTDASGDGTATSSSNGNYVQEAAGGKAPSSVWVFKVDDCDVYLNEVNFYALSLLQGLGVAEGTDMNAYYSAEYPTMDSAFKAQLLVQMRQSKILYLRAVQNGITLTDEEIEEMNGLVDTFMESYDQEKMEKFGLDREVVTKIYTEMGMISKLEKSIEADADVESEDYGSFYNIVFLTIETDETGNAVMDEDGNYVPLSEEEQAQMKANAEECYARLQEGEDVESLIQEYSLGNTSGIVYASSASLKEAYGLKDGEISEVAQEDYGYKIVKIVKNVDSEYSEKRSSYVESTAKSDAIEQQEKEWFNLYFFTNDDLDSEVWNKFTFQDFL